MKMRVAFYKGERRLFDRLVRAWTRKNYSHCELVVRVLPTGLCECVSSSALDGGVRHKVMAMAPERWDFVEVDCDEQRVEDWLNAHEGEGYDYIGLLGYVFRPLKGRAQRWVCCEAVADILGLPESWRFDLATLHAALAWAAGGRQASMAESA